MGFGCIAKYLALIVAGIAVSIGFIGKYAPALFLKVDNGFILWAMTGNPMPPYFSADPWVNDEHLSWLKSGDLVVSVAAKAGTTWMLYVSHLIRTKGDTEKYPFRDVNYATPHIECVNSPGKSWAEEKDLWNTTVLEDGTPLKQLWDHEDYPYRVFKSHFSPDTDGGVIPVKARRDVKFLAMTRNGLDMVASLIPFFDAHSEQFRKMWGGFPPVSSGTYEEDANARFNDLLPGGMFEDFFFGYNVKWWKARHEPNVLFLHYSDAKKDLRGHVRKIAKFLEVELTEAELDVIVEKASFASMKAQSHMFLYSLPLNPAYDGTAMKPGGLTRKGAIGEGQQVFSDEQKREWAEVEERIFSEFPGLLEFARNGGDYY